MKGRWAWRAWRLYLIAYWRTAEQRDGYSPSYGLSLRINRWATVHIEVEWFAGRRAGVIELGVRAATGDK